MSHVGFAPYENPEIAYAVVIPNITTSSGSPPPATNELAEAAVDKYFELKAKRNQTGGDSEALQKIKQPLESESE